MRKSCWQICWIWAFIGSFRHSSSSQTSGTTSSLQPHEWQRSTGQFFYCCCCYTFYVYTTFTLNLFNVWNIEINPLDSFGKLSSSLCSSRARTGRDCLQQVVSPHASSPSWCLFTRSNYSCYSVWDSIIFNSICYSCSFKAEQIPCETVFGGGFTWASARICLVTASVWQRLHSALPIRYTSTFNSIFILSMPDEYSNREVVCMCSLCCGPAGGAEVRLLHSAWHHQIGLSDVSGGFKRKDT